MNLRNPYHKTLSSQDESIKVSVSNETEGQVVLKNSYTDEPGGSRIYVSCFDSANRIVLENERGLNEDIIGIKNAIFMPERENEFDGCMMDLICEKKNVFLWL